MSVTTSLGIIGYDIDGEPLCVDLDRLLVTRLLVQGSSGAGKSRAIRKLLEATFGQVQHIVIDSEGEFHTLREKFDYILAAKEGGDCPADVKSARLLAERVLELGISAILDISELPPADRAEFVRIFVESLLKAPKKLWHPVMIVIDEAQRFCPESDNKQLKATKDAIIDLMTRGRKRGLCTVLAAQRISSLSKDAAAECLNKLIGRTSLDIDRDRAGKELGFVGRDNLALRNVEVGEFYAFGPALSQNVTKIRIGDVVTTHPRPGERAALQTAAPERIKAVLDQLANIPQEAAEEEQSIEALQDQIRRLQRELSDALEAGGSNPAAIQAALDDAARQSEQDMRSAVDEIARLQDEVVRARKALMQINELSAQTDGLLLPEPFKHRPIEPLFENIPRSSTPPSAVTRPASTTPHDRRDSGLGSGEKKVLIAVAQNSGGATREELTQLTGFKRSTRDAYIQRLSAKGFLEISGNGLHATKEGIRALGRDYQPLPTGRALLNHWLQELPDGESQVLKLAASTYPRPVTRDRVSEVTGYKRSTRDAYIQRLVARRLITTDYNGITASKLLIS